MLAELPIHPMIVHFPIVLLITGFFFDLAALLLKKTWLGQAALLLLVLGSLGAVSAVLAGHAEEDRILKTPAIEHTLEEHEEGGELVMWVFLGITAVRGGLTWWGKFTPAMRWLFLAVWAAGLGILVVTAYHGGELVYRHGAGVAAVAAPAGGGSPSEEPPE